MFPPAHPYSLDAPPVDPAKEAIIAVFYAISVDMRFILRNRSEHAILRALINFFNRLYLLTGNPFLLVSRHEFMQYSECLISGPASS
jgi:hypothetical protein